MQSKLDRQSLRLKSYDYTQAGAYFVTICAQDRACLFGEVAGERVHLNEAGQIAEGLWADLPTRFPGLELDIFVVMPNHIHGIVVLPDRNFVGAPHSSSKTSVNALIVGAHENDGSVPVTRAAPTLGGVVGAFKSLFTVRYIQGVKTNNWLPFNHRLWQRNYYEHVIRDEADLVRVRSYIDQNPQRWEFDEENPGCS